MFIGYWVHKPKPGPGLCPVNPCALAKRLKIFCCVQRNMPIGGQAIEQTLIFREFAYHKELGLIEQMQKRVSD